jgi:hypothetical protein
VTTIADSLTYAQVSDVTDIDQVVIQAAPRRRPVLRMPAPAPNVNAWTLVGNAESTLELDGLLISGGDVILRGTFASVKLSCCTLDPGNTSESALFSQAVDGRDLRPSRLWIEAEVRQLTVDRSIVGPIRTRKGGEVEMFSANDSIIQGIRTSGFGILASEDVQDPAQLARVLRAPAPLSTFLIGFLSAAARQALANWSGVGEIGSTLLADLVSGLNSAIGGPSIFAVDRFADIHLSQATTRLMDLTPTGADLIRLNRMLLEEAYPVALAQSALALAGTSVHLSRSTVLGRLFVHRLEASECILDDFGVVDDTQHGCVRFTAWTRQSVLPRPYESVEVAAHGALFGSRQFGQPAYAQLLPTADSAILAPVGGSIGGGAESGSQMGAFAREIYPIKERSLLIKYQEYMPLGLVPVVVHVT